MFEFPPLQIKTVPSVAEPTGVMALARGLESRGERWRERTRSVRAVRSREEIERAIRAGEVSDFRFVEWLLAVRILQAMETIEPVLDPDARMLALQTARLAWDVAAERPAVFYMLIRRVVKRLLDPEQLAPICLLSSLDEPRKSMPATLKLAQEVVSALRKGVPKGSASLAAIARRSHLGIKALLERHGCPGLSQPGLLAMEQVPREFHLNGRGSEDESWLITCLSEMPPAIQREAVAYLLTQIPPELAGDYPRLVAWLRERYQVFSSGSKELSPQLIERLRGWVGAVNFKDFERLVRRLVDSGLLDSYADAGRSSEVDKMWRRYAFWSNYRTHFRRLRILLPPVSRRHFPVEDFNTDEVSVLVDDGAPQTEICVFDFETLLVVEFFRGRPSETIFIRNPGAAIRRELFDKPALSVYQVRYVCDKAGGEWLDHMHMWQQDRERELHRLGISPELTDGKFVWDPRRPSWPYSSSKGALLNSSSADRDDRLSCLMRWEDTVQRLKQDVRRWAKQKGLTA